MSNANRNGAIMARRQRGVDFVSGMPDSGVAHAIGYSNEASIPYVRPFISITPHGQEVLYPKPRSKGANRKNEAYAYNWPYKG